MKKKSVQNMKRTGMLEKKQIFGIRQLKVGVASVGIAAAL
ncbi:YSIRK-type signal peptide-containing protein, partial [Streptococcus suis]